METVLEDSTAPTESATTNEPKSSKQDINPWSVSGEVDEEGKVKAIDYRKLIDEFGTSSIDDALLERWEKVTGSKPHRFMRRGIFFSHRDLHMILDRYEKVGCELLLCARHMCVNEQFRMNRSSSIRVVDPAAIACTLATRKSLTLSSTWKRSMRDHLGRTK